jgi:phage shock protein PspC (stress-responsive transcriptional regulator)
MQKVVTINLNGQAYQFDEDAYEAIHVYLDRAEAKLHDNPDRAEILADLEQAIADKCRRYLNAHKTVIAAAEIRVVLEEMGPVEAASDGAEQKGGGPTSGPDEQPRSTTRPAPRRLYRIDEGAMIGGVCNGIAAFFGIDVTLVRVIFAVLAALELASSHIGAVVIAYIVMMFVVPLAATPEEQAAAHGVRVNAQEVIDRARRNITEFNDRGWYRQRREWRRQQRQWTRHWRQTMRFQRPGATWAPAPPSGDYGTRVAAGIMTSVLAVASLLLFLTFLYGLISLISTGGIATWRLPENVPLWLGTLALFFTYYIVAWPLHMARRASYYAVGGSIYGWDAGGYGLISAALTMLLVWLAYQHVPEVRNVVDRLPAIWEDVQRAITQPR